MIPLSEVFNWLNREDGSHLSNKGRFSIWQVNDPKLPDSQKDTMIEALVNSARTSQDELEYAEVLVFAGKTQGERRRFCESMVFLNHAIARYISLNQVYRAAVTRLMLSNIQLLMGDNNSSYANFRSARDTFEKITNEKRQALLEKDHRLPGLEKDVVWYTANIDLINDTWIEQPEEAYSWLNLFGESFLSLAAKQLRETVIRSLIERNFWSAYRDVSGLQEMVRGSHEPCERAEVYAFSGLSYFQMGNSKDAEKLLRQATSLFPPDRHHHTIVRWMHAMLIARDRSRLSEAVRMCNDCVLSFEGLRLDADHRNREKERGWYQTQANNTRRVTKKIAERI